jgi:hypothetical protein
LPVPFEAKVILEISYADRKIVSQGYEAMPARDASSLSCGKD